jgi:hypothetical protein
LESQRDLVSHHRLAQFVAEEQLCFLCPPVTREKNQ